MQEVKTEVERAPKEKRCELGSRRRECAGSSEPASARARGLEHGAWLDSIYGWNSVSDTGV